MYSIYSIKSTIPPCGISVGLYIQAPTSHSWTAVPERRPARRKIFPFRWSRICHRPHNISDKFGSVTALKQWPNQTTMSEKAGLKELNPSLIRFFLVNRQQFHTSILSNWILTIDLVLIDPQSVGKRTHDLMDTVNAKKRWKTIYWRVNKYLK
jgi:hypothetical protein